MTPEDGTGITGADTYVDPSSSYAVAYMGAHLYADDWNAASLPKKQNACIMASRTLDASYDWNGRPTTTTQGLGWPRSGFTVDWKPVEGLPDAIKAATLELALALIQKNRISDTAAGAAAVKSLTLGSGAIKLDFDQDPVVNTPIPSSQMIPPYVRRLLAKYGDTAGNGMVRLERR